MEKQQRDALKEQNQVQESMEEYEYYSNYSYDSETGETNKLPLILEEL